MMKTVNVGYDILAYELFFAHTFTNLRHCTVKETHEVVFTVYFYIRHRIGKIRIAFGIG